MCAPVKKAHLKKADFQPACFSDYRKFSISLDLCLNVDTCLNVVEAVAASTSLICRSKTFEWRSRSKTAPQLSRFAMVAEQLGKGKGMQITQYDVKLEKAAPIQNKVVGASHCMVHGCKFRFICFLFDFMGVSM